MRKYLGLMVLLGVGFLQAQVEKVPPVQSEVGIQRGYLRVVPSHEGSESDGEFEDSRDPNHFSARGITLRRLLCFAYNIADCQGQIAGATDQLDKAKYDVEAQLSPGRSKLQLQHSLRSILKLDLAYDGYDLVLAADGSTLSVRPILFNRVRVGAMVSVLSIVVVPSLISYFILLLVRRRSIGSSALRFV